MSNLTEKEVLVLTEIAENHCDVFGPDDNNSWFNARDISEGTGLGLQAVGGVMTSLAAKGLIHDSMESARGANINDFTADPEEYLKYSEVAHLVDEE